MLVHSPNEFSPLMECSFHIFFAMQSLYYEYFGAESMGRNLFTETWGLQHSGDSNGPKICLVWMWASKSENILILMLPRAGSLAKPQNPCVCALHALHQTINVLRALWAYLRRLKDSIEKPRNRGNEIKSMWTPTTCDVFIVASFYETFLFACNSNEICIQYSMLVASADYKCVPWIWKKLRQCWYVADVVAVIFVCFLYIWYGILYRFR